MISSECWFLSAHSEQTGNLKIMHALFLLFPCCCLVAKSCSALCKPMHCSLPGFSVHGIPRQDYWSGLPFPSWRYVPDPGIELVSPALARRFFTAEPMSPPLQKLSQPAQAWAADGEVKSVDWGLGSSAIIFQGQWTWACYLAPVGLCSLTSKMGEENRSISVILAGLEICGQRPHPHTSVCSDSIPSSWEAWMGGLVLT